MKFCTKCGKELMDDAVICTGCGCLFDQKIKKPEPEKTKKTTDKPINKNKKMVVFDIVIDSIVYLIIFFLFMSIIFGTIDCRGFVSNGFLDGWGNFFTDCIALIIALILCVASLVLAIYASYESKKYKDSELYKFNVVFIKKIIFIFVLLVAVVIGLCLSNI